MISYVGLDCPACHRPFIEEDDIVVCPVCGAPHHRDCWNRLGHCACEESHGTDHELSLIHISTWRILTTSR